MGSSDIDQVRAPLDARLDGMFAADRLRAYQKQARRTGLLESYSAAWHYSGGCLDPRRMARVRVNRYRVRTTIKAEAFVPSWRDAPTEVKRRFLIGTEWQRVVEWIDAAGFWQLPSRHYPSSAGFHGESWVVEGFRDGRFHFVRRTTWSVLEGIGAEVFRLGKCLGHLAELSVFEET
jgi:hypothetical protein